MRLTEAIVCICRCKPCCTCRWVPSAALNVKPRLSGAVAVREAEVDYVYSFCEPSNSQRNVRGLDIAMDVAAIMNKLQTFQLWLD